MNIEDESIVTSEQEGELEEIPNEKESKKVGFWFGFGGETAMYSQYGLAFAPSFALGFGNRVSIGVKGAWFFTKEEIDVLEVNLLLRVYCLRNKANSGLFVDVMGGPALFNRHGDFSTPSSAGSVSAGAAVGWRFVLFNMWYIEPSIRGGYPYLFGATISTGIQL